MTDRKSMDAPAQVMAILMGVTLIAVGAGAIIATDEPLREFQIRWSEAGVPASTASVTLPGENEATAQVDVSGVPASVTLRVAQCQDQSNANLYAPAEVSWTLTETIGTTTTEIDTGSYTCADQPEAMNYQRGDPPGLELHGNTPQAAQQDLDGQLAGLAQNVTYTLTMTVTPATMVAPLPLDPNPPSFAGAMGLAATTWAGGAVEEIPDEVLA